MSDLIKRLREHAACHADIAKFNDEQAQWERDLLTAAERLAEAEALLREIYSRDRHFDSGAWLIRMYHNDYASIHALITPDSASVECEK